MVPEEKRVTMFTGKGGVGKTTCAAATALHHFEFQVEPHPVVVRELDPASYYLVLLVSA